MRGETQLWSWLREEHWLRPSLEQPGRAQWWRSLAPDALALEPEEAALVVAPLSAEQAESVTGCGEIDMAEASAKTFFTAHSSLSRSATSAVMAAASATRSQSSATSVALPHPQHLTV